MLDLSDGVVEGRCKSLLLVELLHSSECDDTR